MLRIGENQTANQLIVEVIKNNKKKVSQNIIRPIFLRLKYTPK